MTTEALIHVKASPLRLDADSSSEEAFITVTGACLRHAEANLPTVLDGQMEGVHQMRVAFRRLRSALKLFRPLIPREASADLVEDVRWLNGFLGPARDWDVFLYEGLIAVFRRFPGKRSLSLFRVKAETIRRSHHRSLRAALSEPRYRAMRERFTDWLNRRVWRDALSNEQRQRLAEPVSEFATALLEAHYQRMAKRGDAFAKLSVEQRHALRIRGKELRYALDFFTSLYPGATVKPYLNALAGVQDCLGVMNDISVARRLLDEAGLNSASAARQLVEGWYGCKLDVEESHFIEVWERFMASERPWQNRLPRADRNEH